MDRRKLLSVFTFRLTSREAARPATAEPPADVVYQAAQVIRSRIDAALDASRRDSAPDRG